MSTFGALFSYHLEYISAINKCLDFILPECLVSLASEITYNFQFFKPDDSSLNDIFSESSI